MTISDHPAQPTQPTQPTQPAKPTLTPTPTRKRRWWIAVAVAMAFLVGMAAGGGSADPAASPEYTALSAQLDESEAAIKTADARAKTADARAESAETTAATKATALETRSKDLDAQSGELDARQVALETREAAVTTTEQQIAATQIANGTWTVGTDIEPGSYRTAEAVTSMCYWAILRSGTNGADIVENDLPEGGFPTVTLSAGQDFENSCGVWNKQQDYGGAEYAIGYATASSVTGPFTKGEEPLLTTDRDPRFVGPGGQDVVTGPDGVDRLMFHSWSAGNSYRAMNALPLRWTDGRPVLTTP